MKFHPTFLLLFLLAGISIAAAQSQSQPNDFNDPNNLSKFNPSFAIIIIILVAALFLMGFFSIYIRQCVDSPNNSVQPLTNATRRAARGLDQSVIETFPILEYSEVKIHKIGKEALECAVCLCEFEDTETLRLIPKCDHVFHPECIDEWLSSHTTCPVCRANLAPQPGESVHERDIEAQNDVVEDEIQTPAEQQNAEADQLEAQNDVVVEVVTDTKTLNRNRTRSNRSRRFRRSHTTGHSIVQPCENTERFTLRLPLEVRKQLINRQLQRASSLIVLPTEGSSRRGYRTGGEGSSRGKILRRLDRSFKSDRWSLTKAPSFLVRALSIRSPKVRNTSQNGEGTSSSDAAPIMSPSAVDSARPPV